MWSNIQEKQKEFESETICYMDALYNSALKLTYNDEEAKDLVQDTYLKAFRFFEQFEPGTNCKAWLFKIMKNTFINKYRSKMKHPENVDFNKVEPFVDLLIDKDYYDSTSLDEDIVNNYLSDEINDALSRLSHEFRMILILSDIEGFTYNEIADIIECPIGTVRSRLSRARKKMFRLLLPHAKKEGFYKEAAKQ